MPPDSFEIDFYTANDSDGDSIDYNNHIEYDQSESERFAFLKGIHPDLDDDLHKLKPLQERSVRKRSSTSNPRHSRDVYDKARGPIHNRSQEHGSLQMEHSMNSHLNTPGFSAADEGGGYGFDENQPHLLHTREKIFKGTPEMRSPSISKSNSSVSSGFKQRRSDSNSIHSIPTLMSKPIEITCTANCDDSLESLPFSVDGMERAKKKIQSQAAKIRDLEAKIEHTQMRDKKKILSPEERLRAHQERKRKENKHLEQLGKWQKPTPLRKKSLVSKIKQKDDFVERIAAEPEERRIRDETEKRVAKTLNKYANSTSDIDSPIGNPDGRKDRKQNKKRLSKGKSRRSLRRKDIRGPKNGNRRDNLMKRLSMSVKERRSSKKDDVPDNLKRTLQGHNIRKKPWRMSNEFNEEAAVEDDEESILSKDNNREIDRCHTCQSREDCEEDKDNPGTFYCARCWVEYESYSAFSKQSNGESHGESLHDDCSELSADSSKYENSRSTLNEEALWVVHDDPKLGSRIACSGSKKMTCLLESKDSSKKNCVRIIIGSIDFCGGIRDKVTKHTDRGTECIRIGNARGYMINYNEVQTRLTKDKSVYEFQLDPNQAIQLNERDAEMSITEFLQNCHGSVDVILGPQCSSGGWYPLREANANSRKIAPQFRSKGIGYIRLGDDMGKNGLAFLSIDSCQTFLSNEPAGRKDDSEHAMRTVSSFTRKNIRSTEGQFKKSRRTSRPQQFQRRTRTGMKKTYSEVDSDDDGDDETSQSSSNEDSDSESDSDESDDEEDGLVKADDLLKELQNCEVTNEIKWKDKADLLIRLGKAIKKGRIGSLSCEKTLNYIQDVMCSKNVNIHVLRSALLVVEKVGMAMKEMLPSQIAWKTIMIETLKLLKSKQVSSIAREVLSKLHLRCYTLGNSLIAISHVLGMGKGDGGKQSKRKSLSSARKNTPSSTKNNEFQKANNVEVIEWLAARMEIEREEEVIEPILEESGLTKLVNIFLKHESHRDAKCRKNAIDGLLHTLLYGIERLGLTIDEAKEFCVELKTSNPRSWSRLIKSMQMMLKGKR
jgi:hypothetical protein